MGGQGSSTSCPRVGLSWPQPGRFPWVASSGFGFQLPVMLSCKGRGSGRWWSSSLALGGRGLDRASACGRGRWQVGVTWKGTEHVGGA